MDFKELLMEILENEECYKVFKSLWDSKKTVSQIREQTKKETQVINEILYKLEINGFIHHKYPKGEIYYEISPIGETAKEQIVKFAIKRLESELRQRR